LWQVALSRKNAWNTLKSIPSFSAIVSLVFMVEFSVNERVKAYYGTIPGLIASGTTGSVFLTVADHLMF